MCILFIEYLLDFVLIRISLVTGNPIQVLYTLRKFIIIMVRSPDIVLQDWFIAIPRFLPFFHSAIL